MATDTETWSLPTTTAPTDAATSPYPHYKGHSPSGTQAWDAPEWDTAMTPSLHYQQGQSGYNSPNAAMGYRQQQEEDGTMEGVAHGKYVCRLIVRV